MKITTERLPNAQLKLTVEPEASQVDEALRKAARKISQRYNVPGFRKGKAPYAAVVRAYGKDVLYEQVVEELGDTIYKQALDEANLKPIAPGVLDEVTYDPLVFHLTLPMPPEVDLGDYRNVRVPRPVVEVTNDEIEAQLLELQEQQAEWLPVEDEGAALDDLRVDVGRALAAEDFKPQPEGHTGGALNMVPAYAGYLAVNAASGITRARRHRSAVPAAYGWPASTCSTFSTVMAPA